VSGLMSNDPPENGTNGASTGTGQPDPSVEAARELADRNRGLADADQTGSDSDQTAADSDQTAADSDQAASDSDQAASDSDQAASDRDFVHGGDADAHESAREDRDRGARQRQEASIVRLQAASSRDHVTRARDLISQERDKAAERHDRELAESDAAWARDGLTATTAEIVLRAAENRQRAAADRTIAAHGRARAAADREQAVRDRDQAARDRSQAHTEHDKLLRQLIAAETDSLTGTRTRAAGLEDFDHEIDRARRMKRSLAIAYVDVVGLKAVNDTHGHAAGDALLQHAVREIRGHLRSYDLVVRIGGDEFLCVMSDASIRDARERFTTIQAALADDSDSCEIKVGFAELEPSDSPAELIRRADAELPSSSRR
jgi:diguanylate cyclase (GGDEF)-like protein